MSKLNLVHVENSLVPLEHTRTQIEFVNGQSLAELLTDAQKQCGIVINGKVVDAKDFAATYPADGDYVVTVVQLAGGGNDSGKNILRIVAMIIIMVYAPEFGAMMGESFWFGAGAMGIGATGWTMAFAVAGSLLVNAMLPPPKPTKNNDSPTYGIDGPKNTSAEGLPVPITYGSFRMGGNILNNYVVNDENTQVLYMLINAGEGPIVGIGDIEVNDQPIKNWQTSGVDTKFHPETDFRPGTDDQLPLSWFPSTTVEEGVSQEFIESWKTVTIGSSGDVYDQVRIDLIAPYGIFASYEGSDIAVTVLLEIEYRLGGSAGAWISLVVTDSVINYTLIPVWAEWVPIGERSTALYTWDASSECWTTQVGNSAENMSTAVAATTIRTPVYGPAGWIDFNGNQRAPKRRSIFSQDLPQGYYEFRYRRINVPSTDARVSDKIYLSSINKCIKESIAYRNTALVAIKIRLSDQLNSIPKVTYMNYGKVVSYYDETKADWGRKGTSNPAWITWDILTNTRYGAGAPASRLNLNKWREWANWCEKNSLFFNQTLDSTSNVWDALATVSRAGHAQIVPNGTRYSVIIERPETPVQLFSVANIIAGTLKESWTSLDDRANEVEITFPDSADGYKPRTLRLADPVAFAAGKAQKTASIDMPGIVTVARANDEAQLLLNLNRFVRCSIEFAAPMDAIACQVGSVISVQHDMPQWGYGGRTEASSTTSLIKLDRPVSMEYGKTYQLLVHSDTVLRQTCTISSIAGDIVFLTGYTGAKDVRRLVRAASNVDQEVLSIYDSSGNYGVTVGSTVGLTTGMSVDLYDTNVQTTKSVVNPLGVAQQQDVTEVTVSSPFSTAPSQFAKWLYGETNKTNKPFRVTRISGSGDYRRDISAIEYNETVYDPNGGQPTLNYSDLSSRQVVPVTIDGVYERLIPRDVYYESEITIAYHSDQQSYLEADVYVSTNDGPFTNVGTNRTSVAFIALRNDILNFKVLARDNKGATNGFADAATWGPFTVLGNISPASQVTNLAVQVKDEGLMIIWDKATDIDYVDTEIRYGADWDIGEMVFKANADHTALIPFVAAGSYSLWAKHFNIVGRESLTATTTLNALTHLPEPFIVLIPSTPVFEAVESRAGTVALRWSDCKTVQPIRLYEIRVGALGEEFTSLTPYAVVAGDSRLASLTFIDAGTKVIHVIAEDAFGNRSIPASVNVILTPADAAPFTDFIFKRAATAPETPTGEGLPFGWMDTPPVPDGNPLWVSFAPKSADGFLLGAWSTPISTTADNLEVEYSLDGVSLWHTDYQPGDVYAHYRLIGEPTWTVIQIARETGLTPTFRFKRAPANEPPDAPTDGVAAGWSDGPPEPVAGQVLFVTMGNLNAEGTLIGIWTTPIQIEGADVSIEYSVDGSALSWHPVFVTGDLFARYSTDRGVTWSAAIKVVGEDGASVVLKGSVATVGELPTVGNTAGDLYVVLFDGNGYVWNGTGWDNVGPIRGPAGASARYLSYVFKRWPTAPDTPTGDTPAEWLDYPPGADGGVLWVSTAIKESTGVLVGAWSTPVQLEGSSVRVEYSVDATLLSWHPTFATGDLYAHYSTDGGGNWSAPIKVVGEDALVYTVHIESTNGTEFRVGGGQVTMLKGIVFLNDSETTDTINASWFRWRRVSQIPQETPNTDAEWNAAYSTGYKQVMISVDDVYARATFFLDIIAP